MQWPIARVAALSMAVLVTVVVGSGCPSSTDAGKVLAESQRRLATARTVELYEESVITAALDGKPVPHRRTERVEFRFKRPGMFVQRDSEHETWVDGARVVQYVPSVRRYSVDRLDSHLRQVIFSGLKWEWGQRVTNEGMALGIDYVHRARSLQRLADARVNGTITYVLRLRMKTHDDFDLTQTMWIGKSDHLIHRSETVTVGLAPQVKVPPMLTPRRRTLTVSVTTRLLKHRLNDPIPDSAFRFVPSAGDRPFARPQIHLLPPTHRR